jgi:hypothetical protein
MFPITFIFSTLNAIFILELCFGGFGKGWNWEDCPKNTDIPCLSSNCKPLSQYSFWLGEPSFHPSADDLPCSPLRQAAVSFSSRFPKSSYKFANNPSSSRFTLAVCTSASLNELDDILMKTLKSSILFSSSLFSGTAQISLPKTSDTGEKVSDYRTDTPFTMQDMDYQYQLGPLKRTSNSSYYASCCTDRFCLDQLRVSTKKQPDKFLWGSIPKITSSTSSKECQSLFECNGGLAMIPVAGPSTCSEYVYVVQISVQIGWLFLAIFIPAFLIDCLFLLLVFGHTISSIRMYNSRASFTTPESMKKESALPPEFFQELISKGKMEEFLRCTRDVRMQFFLDQAQLNIVTAAFAKFYVLLNSLEPTAPYIAYVEMYMSTNIGQQHYHYYHPSFPTRPIPKHWKVVAKSYRAGPIRLLMSLTVIILINIVYPALSFSSLASCPSLQRTFNIMVMIKAVGSIIYMIFSAIKDANILGAMEK